MDAAFTQLRALQLSIVAACELTGRSRATHYRRARTTTTTTGSGEGSGEGGGEETAGRGGHRPARSPRPSGNRSWRC